MGKIFREALEKIFKVKKLKTEIELINNTDIDIDAIVKTNDDGSIQVILIDKKDKEIIMNRKLV